MKSNLTRILLFFFILIGGYGCNKTPKIVIEGGSGESCVPTKDQEAVGIENVQTGSNSVDMTIGVKVPCDNVEAEDGFVYSLAVYNADNLVIPSNLTQDPPTYTGILRFYLAGCTKDGEFTYGMPNAGIPGENGVAADDELLKLLKGNAVSLFVGMSKRNTIYSFATKISIDNKMGTDSTCTDGMVTDPLILDNRTKSAISDTSNNYLYADSNQASAIALYGQDNTVIGIGAPYATRTVLSDKAIGGTPGIEAISNDSSAQKFRLRLHIKPGKYYFVLAAVRNPMSSIALSTVKVYSNSGTKDYVEDCGYNIDSCGTAVTVS